MALNLLLATTPFLGARFSAKIVPITSLSGVKMAKPLKTRASTPTLDPVVVRRSANYHSSVWDKKYLQSLKSDYKGDPYERQHKMLKEAASCLLKEASGPIAQLELIDDIQHLGIGYLFEKEIEEMLDSISDARGEKYDFGIGDDLHRVSICFRLLRERGFEVSQDVFKVFMDESGNFSTSICGDAKGLLSLYEASFLSVEGETILDEAEKFAVKHLNSLKGNIDEILAKQVEHSLEFPLHKRVQRLEARWYIEEVCERREDMSPVLLELAKLDYNMVQAIYQEDVKSMSRWWKNLELGERLGYIRDRLVECFLWGLGIMSHPQFRYCRQELTKVNQLITVFDDLYDVYGTVEELELFTDAVERWNTDVIQELPQYMKTSYLAVYNSVNELGYHCLKEQGVEVIPCLKKAWADLCKAYLTEAKWYHSKCTPTFDEYLNNAWVSISGHVVMTHAYVSMEKKITKEAIECLENRRDPLRWPFVLFRLTDDWGTSLDELSRGDVLKSIQCYMHESGASEAAAREHISGLLSEGWKKINKDQVSPSPFSKSFMRALVDLVRISHSYYQHGNDGFGSSDGETKEKLIKLIVEPIY